MGNETTRHYIATDADRAVIYGIGPTPWEAGDDARDNVAEDAAFLILSATERLVAKVEADGGDHRGKWWTDDAPRSYEPDLSRGDDDGTRWTADLEEAV